MTEPKLRSHYIAALGPIRCGHRHHSIRGASSCATEKGRFWRAYRVEERRKIYWQRTTHRIPIIPDQLG